MHLGLGTGGQVVRTAAGSTARIKRRHWAGLRSSRFKGDSAASGMVPRGGRDGSPGSQAQTAMGKIGLRLPACPWQVTIAAGRGAQLHYLP